MRKEIIYVWPRVRLRMDFGRAGMEPPVQIEGVVRRVELGEERFKFEVEGVMYWSSGNFADVFNGQTQVSRLLFDYLVATGVIKRLTFESWLKAGN